MPSRRRRGSPSEHERERSKRARGSYRRAEQTAFSHKVCTTWFKEYSNDEGTCIEPEGMEKFCEDIGVEPENVVMLALAYKLGAQSMGFFKLEEWMKGMKDLECDSITKVQAKLDHLRTMFSNASEFKNIFRFAFDFAKEDHQRSLDRETAKSMLTLLLGGQWPLQASFNQFLDQSSRYQVMNKDQWCNVLEFSKTISHDLSNYDEDGAWPVMMDEFVEWYKEGQGQGQAQNQGQGQSSNS